VIGPNACAQLTKKGDKGSFSIAAGNKQDFMPILDRLETFQSFSARNVWHELFRRNNSDGSAAHNVPGSVGFVFNLDAQVQLLVPGGGRRWLSEFSPPASCVAINDAAGERLWIIVRPKKIEGDDPGVDPSWIQSTQELLIIDSSGNLASPIESPVGILLGKLSDPLGKADQLVFGKAMRLAIPSTRKVEDQLVRVCIVEHGQLKTVQELNIPDRGQKPQDR
jgi:hypothetical protein